MKNITIEMFPAENGDAFLLRFDNKKNILIDMGYSDTYRNYIRDRLIALKKEDQLINLLVITHIDEDHIEGAIEFLKENGKADNPNIVEIKEIWHNAYRHLQFNSEKVESISKAEIRRLEEVILNNSGADRYCKCESEQISAEQGSTLAGYLYGLGYQDRWNRAFYHKAINLDSINRVDLGDINLMILSPNTNKLKRLSKVWIDKLEEFKFDFPISDEEIFDDAYEMYIKKLKSIIAEQEEISYDIKSFESIIKGKITKKHSDYSESNGASISFIIEYKDKKLLFLGDAHEEIVLDSLKRYEEQNNNLDFDVIKVSHHGSIKNNFKWIKKLKAKKYLISTNGKKHGHPNDEVVAEILKENMGYKLLYFNYPIEICNILNDDNLKEEYNYSLRIGDGISSLIVEVDEK